MSKGVYKALEVPCNGTSANTTMASGRNWCFTINNWKPEELKALEEWDAATYLVVGKEVGENKTPHLQGYVEFGNSMRFQTFHNKFPRAHLEKRRGTAQQAADYCKKAGDFIERGKMSKQGSRSDIYDMTDAIKAGKRTAEIADLDPVTFVKFHKGLEAFRNAHMKDRTEKPYVEWRYGLTGTGKTFRVVEQHGAENVFIKDGTQWWDGYSQQQVILMDDMDAADWKKNHFRDFLRLLDRYPYKGQVKGSYVKINSPYLYITCEHPPQHYWANNELAQVLRRLNCLVECKADGDDYEEDVQHGEKVCGTCGRSGRVILIRPPYDRKSSPRPRSRRGHLKLAPPSPSMKLPHTSLLMVNP